MSLNQSLAVSSLDPRYSQYPFQRIQPERQKPIAKRPIATLPPLKHQPKSLAPIRNHQLTHARIGDAPESGTKIVVGHLLHESLTHENGQTSGTMSPYAKFGPGRAKSIKLDRDAFGPVSTPQLLKAMIDLVFDRLRVQMTQVKGIRVQA
jgi:hypothetical protein